MFTRFRIALALSLLLAMMASLSVSAKGGFAFITITGANLKESIRAADRELTYDFFAFADFYQNKAEEPANPGAGYEITRYYIDNNREVAFDKLHYYPDTGFVFYDGIVNGSSEYDGKWYTARPEIKAVFEGTLATAVKAAPVPNKTAEQAQSSQPIQQTQPSRPLTEPAIAQPMMLAAGLAAIVLILFLSRRKRMA